MLALALAMTTASGAELQPVVLDVLLEDLQNWSAREASDPRCMRTTSFISYMVGDTTRALELMRDCLEVRPWDPAVWNTLSHIYKIRGDYETEEMMLRQALHPREASQGPVRHDWPETVRTKRARRAIVRNNLALNHVHQGRYAEAARLFRALEREQAGSPHFHLHRAALYSATGEPSLAVREIDLVVAAGCQPGTVPSQVVFDLARDPAFDPIRSSPGFQRAQQRLVDEYVGQGRCGP